MAKKKIVKPVEVEEVIEEIKEEIKEEDKAVVESIEEAKKRICEFYGIQDAELLSPECDLSKYGLKKGEEEVLVKWIEENKKVKSWDVVFDIYTTNKEAWAIIEKYGLHPEDVAEWKLDGLTEEEKEIITAHYNDLIAKL